MANTVNAPSAAPIRKVTSFVVASAIVTLAMFVLDRGFNYSVQPDVAGALVTLIGFLVAYIVPSAAGDAP